MERIQSYANQNVRTTSHNLHQQSENRTSTNHTVYVAPQNPLPEDPVFDSSLPPPSPFETNFSGPPPNFTHFQPVNGFNGNPTPFLIRPIPEAFPDLSHGMCQELNASILTTRWDRRAGFDGPEWVSNATLREGLPNIEGTSWFDGLRHAAHFLECHAVGRSLVLVLGMCVGAATLKFLIIFVSHLPIPSRYRDSLVWLLEIPFNLLTSLYRVVRRGLLRQGPMVAESVDMNQAVQSARGQEAGLMHQPVTFPPLDVGANPAYPDSGYTSRRSDAQSPSSGLYTPQVRQMTLL